MSLSHLQALLCCVGVPHHGTWCCKRTLGTIAKADMQMFRPEDIERMKESFSRDKADL